MLMIPTDTARVRGRVRPARACRNPGALGRGRQAVIDRQYHLVETLRDLEISRRAHLGRAADVATAVNVKRRSSWVGLPCRHVQPSPHRGCAVRPVIFTSLVSTAGWGIADNTLGEATSIPKQFS